MDWYALGHAMWLAEAEGLRLLFDPLLEPRHHGGVFEVRPRRTVRAEALRADFVLVSHRHGDHFDVPSLRRLARLDPDSVVITPDDLVAWAARKVGFRTVRQVPAAQRVELDRVRLVTTPSVAPDEWGALVETRAAVVWNQVDSVARDATHLRAMMDQALAAVDRPADHRLELALVAWQPMLEIAAVTGGATGFPLRRYDELLRGVAALRPRYTVPSACGSRHAGDAGWLERHVYPVPEARLARDVARVAPDVSALALQVGGRYRIGGGEVELEPRGGADLVELREDEAPFWYDPLDIPPLEDPDRGRAPVSRMRARVDEWVRETLAPALARSYPSMGVEDPLRLSLEVVWATARDAYTVVVSHEGARIERALHPDWDVLDRAAGSLLYEVIEGRYCWGDMLLGGVLRSVRRTYVASEQGLRAAKVAPIFLYYALPYDESTRRAVVWEVCGGESA